MSYSHTTYQFEVNSQKNVQTSKGGNSVNSDSSLYLDDPNADSFGADISIALIGPEDDSREALASVIADC